jgi:hypothetical protein
MYITVCFDVCHEFVVLGTFFGKILVWKVYNRVDDLDMMPGCLEQRIDKISIRHGKIIAVQNGLISVFSSQQGFFTFLYCKSFENPDRRLLAGVQGDRTLSDKYSMPNMDREQFQLRYKPLTPAKFPDQDFTISTTGRERFAAARVGETEVTVHNLIDGNVTQTFSLPQDLKVMKLDIVHLDQFSSLLYLLTWQGDDKTSLQGLFYDLDTQEFILINSLTVMQGSSLCLQSMVCL